MDNVFVECGADLQHSKFTFTRKHFMAPHQTQAFREKYHNMGVYETVMKYVNPEWFQDEKGKFLINARDSLKWGDFYLDFDTVIESEEDYNKLRADVGVAIRYLKIILSIEPSQMQFFYSGNKGLHLTVDARVFGLEPHPALNQIYKSLAVDIAEYCTFHTLDVRVYDDKRMFRMINSYNLKGERYKVPITYEELHRLSYEEIRALGKSPRYLERPQPAVSSKAKKAVQKYIDEWTQRIEKAKEFSGKIQTLDKAPACIDAMMKKVFRETIDERNNSATALTSYFMQAGLDRMDTMQRMNEWNQSNCSPPLLDREISATVHSIYNSQFRYGCESFKRLSGVCDEKCPLRNKRS